MSNERRVTRRRFLQIAGSTTGFSVMYLANGNKIVAQTPADIEYKEAPQLAELVAAGSLPPVNERLPDLPLVVDPVESIGKYGGTWRTAVLGGADQHIFQRYVGYDHLVRWAPDWNEVVPGVASAYEVSDEGRTYTFTLRPGMRWSDGEPFTADDPVFYVEAVTLNETIGGQGNRPFTAQKIDDYTFSVTFEEPYGLFLQNSMCGLDSPWTQHPKHYLSQFHPDYNTDNLDQLIKDAGAADWAELFRTKGGTIPGTPYNALWMNPELPRLHAWKMVNAYGDGTRVTFERNPYYWKVDTDGNQLPYIDGLHYDVIDDVQVLLLKAVAGELDMHMRHFCTSRNKPVIADGMPESEMTFFEALPSIMNTDVYMLNLCHNDPVLREIFTNKDFRIGLSHAINRQEVIDVVYVSQGEPWQAAPRPETPYYNETLAKQYTEFDLDLANEYLDKVVPEKDNDGFRLRPDGQRLSFVLEVASGGEFPEMVDAASLVTQHWRAAGIDVQMKPEDRSLLVTRVQANEHDASVWPGGSGLQDAMLNPYMYMPNSTYSFYGIPWYYWWKQTPNPDAEPQEPPELVKQQMDLYDQIQEMADPEEQTRLLKEILELSQELFLNIGIGSPAPGYGIRKTYFRNVPASMPDAAVYPNPGPTNPAQYYFDV